MKKTHKLHLVTDYLDRIAESPRILQLTILLLISLLAVMVRQNRKILRRDFSSNPPFREIMVGHALAPVTLKTLEGSDFNLSDLPTHQAVLIFFDVNCSYCTKDIPLWLEMYEQSKTRDVTILGITTGANREDVSEYVRKNNLQFPVLLDQRQELFTQLKISATPTKILCSSDWRILQVWEGWTTQRSHQSDLGGMYTFLGIEPDQLPLDLK